MLAARRASEALRELAEVGLLPETMVHRAVQGHDH
jgi:hypothetical protein